MTDLRNCICKVGNGSYDRFLRCEGQRDEMPAWDYNFLLKSHLDMATLRMTSVIELQSWYCSSTELSQSVCLLYEVYLRTNFYISLARVPRDFSSEMYCRLGLDLFCTIHHRTVSVGRKIHTIIQRYIQIYYIAKGKD